MTDDEIRREALALLREIAGLPRYKAVGYIDVSGKFIMDDMLDRIDDLLAKVEDEE